MTTAGLDAVTSSGVRDDRNWRASLARVRSGETETGHRGDTFLPRGELWHDDSGHWFRSYGNENWEFDSDGLMRRRLASINDLPIGEAERKYFWPLGRRPDDHPGLSDLGL